MRKGWITDTNLIWNIKLDTDAKDFLSKFNHTW
ncbi:Uncharacterised protein [Mycobacterium tuberculosis]|nr:Uncharacterised protein [Mycobacterium tuberculosis]